ncbi:MAG TPA: hypothetical protein VK470_15965 [Bacteroidota bacterium]|nr:hypothetical protein [Bacteroidota bacterium]
MSKLFIDLFAEKHIGRDQGKKEVCYFCASPGTNPKMSPDILAVLSVADGMGGSNADVGASTIVTEYLAYLFMKGGYHAIAKPHGMPGVEYPAFIKETFRILNVKVRDRASILQRAEIAGTTCVFGIIAYHPHEDKTYLHVGNVGNSRCSIVRNGESFHATENDTLAWQLYKTGKITYAEMLVHPLHQKSAAVGAKETIESQVHSIELLQNDILIFSTNGLHEIVDDTEIEYILNRSSNTAEAVKGLVAAAKAAHGVEGFAVALAICSQTPVEVNSAWTAGWRFMGISKRTKKNIGIWAGIIVFMLAAVSAYFILSKSQIHRETVQSTFVSAAVPEPKDTALDQRGAVSLSAASAKRVASAPITVASPSPKQIAVQGAPQKTTATFPSMTVEWIAETKRFRIQVNEASVVPVSVSYDGTSYDVAPVKSIPNLFRTTTPTEVETSMKHMITVRLKAPERRAGVVAFTIID